MRLPIRLLPLLVSTCFYCSSTSATDSSSLRKRTSQHNNSQRRLDAVDDLLDDASLPQHDGDSVSKQPRIVNGQDMTDSSRYPWFVQLRTEADESGIQIACGGSLIAPDIVLTAAHCVCEPKDENGNRACGNFDFVLTGGVTTSIPLTGTRYEIADSVRHPNFPGELQIDYDLMVVGLTEPVPASVAEPIPLAWSETELDAGFDLRIMGFGNTDRSEDRVLDQPTTLQIASTSYVPLETCAVAEDPETGQQYGLSWPDRTIVEEYWFCTLDELTATCFGDSGGPVFGETSNEPSGDTLYAVISGGPSGYCGNPYLPLWNNRISFHKQWIVETACSLSNAPPAEFNCDEGGVAPDGPVAPVEATTPAPTRRPTPSPVAAPTTPSPTRRPTPAPVVDPTPAPTNAPTTPAPVVDPTPNPSATPSISAAPNNFIDIPAPSETADLTPRPDGGNSGGNGDDLSLCDICGEGQEATALSTVVNVPTLGSFTCEELQALEMTSTQCGITQSLTQVACDCQPLPPSPTLPPSPSAPPTNAPTPTPVASPTAAPTKAPTRSPTLSPATTTTPPIFLPTLPPGTPTATPTVAPPPSETPAPVEEPTTAPNNNNEPTISPVPTIVTIAPTILPPNCTSRDDFEGELVDVTVKLQFDDDNADEISWYIIDETESCYRVGVLQYPAGLQSSQQKVQLKLGEMYMFVITSSSGDGLGDEGTFQVYSDKMLASGGGDFGHKKEVAFTVEMF